MGGAPVTTTWRGIVTDPETARFLDAVAAEVTNMTKAAGVPDFNVTPIPGFGSYRNNTASAGTDSGGGHVDLNAEPLTDIQARILESAARKKGGTAYFRPRKSPTGFVYGWQRHVHVLRSDCADLSAPGVKQVGQYRRGLNGLADNGPDIGDRSWVNVTWGAVKKIADTISAIGGATATEDIMTPAQEAKLDQALAAINGLRSEESGRYVTYSNRHGWIAGALNGIASKVGVDIDESALAKAVSAALTPTIRKAVLDAGQTDAVADAVVAKLGAALNPVA